MAVRVRQICLSCWQIDREIDKRNPLSFYISIYICMCLSIKYMSILYSSFVLSLRSTHADLSLHFVPLSACIYLSCLSMYIVRCGVRYFSFFLLISPYHFKNICFISLLGIFYLCFSVFMCLSTFVYLFISVEGFEFIRFSRFSMSF